MNKTIIVTGATSGIGLAVVREFLSLGYQVIGIGHSAENSALAAASITGQFGPSAAVFFTADLMQQRQVSCLADELSAYLEAHCGGELQALINNAGCVRSWYATTEEGYEQQFALNHLAGFMLACRLMPFLQRAHGLVLFTGSGSHKGLAIHWQDVMLKDRYNPLLAYKQSKLCNMLLARELNNRFRSAGVTAYVVDPGLVKTDIGNKQTGALVNLVWSLRKKHGQPPEVPAKTYSFLCAQKTPPAGLYFHNCRERRYSKQVTDENARRLFALSEQLCGFDLALNS